MKHWTTDTILELKVQIARRCADPGEDIEIEYVNPKFPDRPLRLTGSMAEDLSQVIVEGLEYAVSESGLTEE